MVEEIKLKVKSIIKTEKASEIETTEKYVTELEGEEQGITAKIYESEDYSFEIGDTYILKQDQKQTKLDEKKEEKPKDKTKKQE